MLLLLLLLLLARLLMAPTTPRVWHCRTVAERRAAAYSAFEEAFKEYAPRPGLAAEREFAAHAAAFSACQSACSAEARAAEAALRAHLGRPDLAGVVDEWQGHERVKFEQTARLQVARRAEALRAAGCCADKDCNCVVAGGAGGVAGRPDEELEAMASANEEVKREAYCALERVCEEINEAIETLKEELEDEGLGCEM